MMTLDFEDEMMSKHWIHPLLLVGSIVATLSIAPAQIKTGAGCPDFYDIFWASPKTEPDFPAQRFANSLGWFVAYGEKWFPFHMRRSGRKTRYPDIGAECLHGAV